LVRGVVIWARALVRVPKVFVVLGCVSMVQRVRMRAPKLKMEPELMMVL
jgi:hypothetical protein